MRRISAIYSGQSIIELPDLESRSTDIISDVGIDQCNDPEKVEGTADFYPLYRTDDKFIFIIRMDRLQILLAIMSDDAVCNIDRDDSEERGTSMKLSVSNIAWKAEDDEKVYSMMRKYGYCGLEIAPTRIFPDDPYGQLEDAFQWSSRMKMQFGLEIASMQSIWFGRTEQIFESEQDRKVPLEYTKRAIDFANKTGCRNLVFGCPRNRNLEDASLWKVGVAFFRELGEYALQKGTVIGMEANPVIYHTNFINDTVSALELIREVHSSGFLLNLDVGTMIENHENIQILERNVDKINHVHISEPNLKLIESRELHRDLCRLLKERSYRNYVSIEMGRTDNLDELEQTLQYVKGIVD